jgi:hypothetical protein
VFTNSGFAAKLKTFLLSVLAGLIIASLLSIISTKRGIYGDKEIILMPLSFFYSTSICIFLFYKEYKSKITIFILAILSLVIQLTYPNALTGKSWLGILYIFFAILIILFQRKQKKALFSIIICFAVFLISMHVILENPNTEKNLSFSKLKQAFMLVSITNSDWYKYLPDSPKTRIEEILNTGIEYYKKPYYLITGKGYGGSIKDHRNTFGYYNEFAFSIDQYNHNTFTSMHETVAVIFLKFGLWGILSFLYIFFLGVANFLRTPWSVIGTLWFIFFVGYSFNLALFGIPALVLGLYESNKENV